MRRDESLVTSGLDREGWLDVLKGLGIIAVVIGHISPKEVSSVIYQFHMPLFFFVSGYLHKTRNFKELLQVRSLQLLLPYCSYLVVLYLLPALASFVLGHLGQVSDNSRFVQTMARAIFGGRLLTGIVGVFWFVTCLFLTQLFYTIIENRLKLTSIHWIAAGFLVGAYLNQSFIQGTILPWNVNVVLFSLPIYHIGYVTRRTGLASSIAHSTNVWKFTFLIIVVITLCIYFGLYGKMDMKNAKYGFPILGLILALFWIVLLSIICMKASQFRFSFILNELGRASMTIMFLHQLVHFELPKIVDLNWVVLTAVSLLVPFAIHKVLEGNKPLSSLFLGRNRNPTKFST